MMHILEKLIEAVEALTRNAASVGSPAHDLIAEARAHFEAAREPKAEDEPAEPMAPAIPYEPPVVEPEKDTGERAVPTALPLFTEPEEPAAPAEQ